MAAKEITSAQNDKVKHIVHLRQNHDYRDDHHSVVILGHKLVKEISDILPIKTLFVYDEASIPKGVKAKEVYIVNEEIMKKASGLMHPEGILAEIEMPKFSNLKDLKKIVALDKISDPGNLGTIIRSALALGFEGVFILDDSCDAFNDKALSAARGATFKLPLAKGSWKDLEAIIAQNKLHPVVADIEGTPLDKLEKHENILLVLGNEAHGVSEQAKKACQKVTIPMQKSMESLNVGVAAGILMYALGK